MEIDSNLLASYRTLLSTTKDTLAHDQFNSLIGRMEIAPTKRLEMGIWKNYFLIDFYLRFWVHLQRKGKEIYEGLRVISVISLNPQVVLTQWRIV